MKRVSLVLAIAALGIPAAAGAAQTHSQPVSPSKASASTFKLKVKIYGTVAAITGSKITVASATKSRTFARGSVSLTGIRIGARVEAEGFVRKGTLRLSGIHLDDRAARTAGPNKPGDDRGGQNAGPSQPSDDLPGDDRGAGHGQDDAPGHH